MNASLVERLAQELDGAFPDLIDLHGPMVLTLATRLTDTTTGQDITQEVFLRAYRALDGYPLARISKLEVRPWLATITRNLVRNEYRRRQRHATVSLDPADGSMALTNAPAQTNDRDVEEFESRDRIDQLLAVLSDPQREAIILRHVVGLPLREVALTMACPEGTAKSHVSRGLTRLRQTLAEPVTSAEEGASQ